MPPKLSSVFIFVYLWLRNHCLAAAFLFLSLFGLNLCAAQLPPPFDSMRVYLITVGPGEEVYEKFGHNMIRVVVPGSVVDSNEDIDKTVNWGMFSFEQPHFLWRFIQGRMLYFSGADDTADQIAGYKQDDRSMWQQELNLTAAQKEHLWEFLVQATDPAHREYRYDYYRDNCSTRTRDALDAALGGQIRRQLVPTATGTTFRWHTRRLMQTNFWLYTALQYVLGHPIDQPINAWQECFLPLRMMNWMKGMKVTDATGKQVPLVMGTQQLYQSREFIEADGPPHWVWIYCLIGLSLAAIFLLPCFVKFNLSTRIGWGLVAFAWCVLGGAAGAILVWGEFFTDHVATDRNENMLQMSPIMVVLLMLIPFAVWGKRWALRAALILAAIQAIGNIAGLLLKVLPVFYQPNWEIIALALPANVGLALGLMCMERKSVALR